MTDYYLRPREASVYTPRALDLDSGLYGFHYPLLRSTFFPRNGPILGKKENVFRRHRLYGAERGTTNLQLEILTRLSFQFNEVRTKWILLHSLDFQFLNLSAMLNTKD